MNIGLEKYRHYYATLIESELFSHVTHNSLNQLLEISTAQNWPKKTCILDTSHTLYTFHILITGNVALEDIPKRLARLLYNNMDKSSAHYQSISGLSHAEIGALIGTTRAVVNRHIQNFKEEGILKVSRKQITITNVRLLEEKLLGNKV